MRHYGWPAVVGRLNKEGCAVRELPFHQRDMFFRAYIETLWENPACLYHLRGKSVQKLKPGTGESSARKSHHWSCRKKEPQVNHTSLKTRLLPRPVRQHQTTSVLDKEHVAFPPAQGCDGAQKSCPCTSLLISVLSDAYAGSIKSALTGAFLPRTSASTMDQDLSYSLENWLLNIYQHHCFNLLFPSPWPWRGP